MQIRTTAVIFKQHINLILNIKHIFIAMRCLFKILHEFSVLLPITLIINVHMCAAATRSMHHNKAVFMDTGLKRSLHT